MWVRNYIPEVIPFLLCLTSILARAEISSTENVKESSSVETEVDLILERATAWLWSQRDKDSGWNNETHEVLLALRLANLSRDDNVPPFTPLDMQLSSKQLELEIVLFLWKHRELGFSMVRLARYTLALNALCIDPRQFHGHDLIGTLQHHEEPSTDYDFALTTLAACSAQAHSRKRQIRRLLDIANSPQNHNLDTVAMVVLAMRCIVQDHRHRNLHHFLRKPILNLAHQLYQNGSFGDIYTTSLVMQALQGTENNEPTDNWNKTAALTWLASQQKVDGSFERDIRLTAQVVLGIAPRSLATIRALDCGQAINVITPACSTTNGIDYSLTETHLETQNFSLTSNTNISEMELTVTSQVPVLVNVSYTLWVGSSVNETHYISVTAPKNETFYNVMLLAAGMSPHFQFQASDWPNGHYVHTISGYKEEPMSYHYWLLYRLPVPPEPSSPPGNQFVAPGGVDDLQISEGEHFLFWYKKL